MQKFSALELVANRNRLTRRLVNLNPPFEFQIFNIYSKTIN